jgi:hypothetical protein
MNLERFCIRFAARPAPQVTDEALFIPIFHDWIRLQKLQGTLIDVADYRHVPEGPGVMLISHEINYSMDHLGGHLGLSAQRKLGSEEDSQARILSLVQAAARFGSLLEADHRISGAVRFRGESFTYTANDRLQAPNSEATFTALKPDLEAVAAALYPDRAVVVERVENDPRDRLAIQVRAEGSVEIAALAISP